MSEAAPARHWTAVLAPRWLAWHLFAVLAVAGMIWLGDWQLRRALGGNTLSWAYTFEWPIFAIFGVVFWIKTIRDELHPAGPRGAALVDLPAGAAGNQPAAGGVTADEGAVAGGDGGGAGRGAATGGEQDQELAEYNAYLAKLSRQVKGHGRWHGLR